jgi:hypothetical protein
MNHVVRHTVIQVAADPVPRKSLVEWTIHRGEESTIDAPKRIGTNRTNPSLLNQIQESHLDLMRELIKLIKKERSLMRLNRKTGAGINCSSERALYVPKKLILCEVPSPKIRLSMHKTPRSPRGTLMDKSGAQSLARSGLAQDEHRLRQRRDEGDAIAERLDSVTPSY